jgi:Family of unknown function (DUF5996)
LNDGERRGKFNPARAFRLSPSASIGAKLLWRWRAHSRKRIMMNAMDDAHPIWPDLTYSTWAETLATLHLWTQIVGKIRLTLTPWLNHSWQTPLYVTARGLGASPIPIGAEMFEIEFDFVAHQLNVRTSRGAEGFLPLRPQSVADFYRATIDLLDSMGVSVAIKETPNEVPNPIRFSLDQVHAAYDPDAAHRFWRALVQADRIFKLFRTGFLGKASPVHFFWGSFDLAVTRFSGRRAPLHPGGVPGLPDDVAREAYSHEVSSAGFWPGNEAFPRASFYSYAYPEPARFRDRPITSGGSFDATLGEFILPYETVARSPDPDGLLLDFLSTTYAAAADTAGWDRAALECPLGVPGRVRPI